jgi:hypothetical protein
VGAALTTTERVGTTRRLGSGKQGRKVYVSRNQWSNPLKARTGSNLVDMGRASKSLFGFSRNERTASAEMTVRFRRNTHQEALQCGVEVRQRWDDPERSGASAIAQNA